ncbi:unnamed protein product [Adineta steineri]|uniref:Uncharacterized protein n=1 Tax=Adineta steineri TaxID=433720 RepID=A0A814L1I3_9BILA|nr:unnamed protein product [Adineta steineri]CAF0973363.1 unnamed protein product [Adineta steineri]CAF1057321.1 unnamed protein product [Adineta steineri]CAF1362313.1 unnamed protein product [Adineta steineri]CAF1600533.1 unnamed protein product [Adineta steineri]
MSHRARNIDNNNNQYYYDDDVSWCEQNMIKLIIIICLTIVAIGCSIALAMVYIQDTQRERAFLAKKNTWTARVEQCAPILNIAGPIIKNLIKVAFSVLLI